MRDIDTLMQKLSEKALKEIKEMAHILRGYDVDSIQVLCCGNVTDIRVLVAWRSREYRVT